MQQQAAPLEYTIIQELYLIDKVYRKYVQSLISFLCYHLIPAPSLSPV